MEKAEVVIIGGGVIGTSIAYHLARKGCRDVILLEREMFLGSGSTGYCAGGIRQQFSTEINIRLCMESLRQFERFKDELGSEIDFVQNGYLFITADQKNWEIFNRNVDLQRRIGLKEVRLVTPEEIREIVPQVKTDDLIGGTFCPTDGYADPHLVVHAYSKRAKEMGVRIYLQREVKGIHVVGNEVKRVITSTGDIETNLVINAAGPYASIVGKMAGLEIPVKPYRRQIFITAPFSEIGESFPMLVDFDTGIYMRRESGGVLMGMADEDEPSSFNTNVDWNFMVEVAEKAIDRVPILEKAQIIRGWAGLYETTPDHHAILGEVPEVRGFICCNGFSGHGFMQAPAAGKLIAEFIVDKSTSIDISPLRIQRFKEEKMLQEISVI